MHFTSPSLSALIESSYCYAISCAEQIFQEHGTNDSPIDHKLFEKNISLSLKLISCRKKESDLSISRKWLQRFSPNSNCKEFSNGVSHFVA